MTKVPVPRSIANLDFGRQHIQESPRIREAVERKPDWLVWKNTPYCKLWQGVALSLGIDPERVKHSGDGWRSGGHLFYESTEFERRLRLAEKNSDPGSLQKLRTIGGSDASSRQIPLQEFATWLFNIFPNDVPSEFRELALANLCPGSVPTLQDYKVEDKLVSPERDAGAAMTQSIENNGSLRAAMKLKVRQASVPTIRQVVRDIYAFASANGLHAPNIKQIQPIALAALTRQKLAASGLRIGEIASEDEFQSCRGRSGVRTSLPAFSLESFLKARPES